ncbi:PREDICTED: cysteine protease ATG4-like isoform X1 [Lupinus angustifolius]|uniref:cysteine protease ATG4-like isoform X1 n=2 Tax=Lupinus angustifolius TaxID=3871 RepID=UPI00092F39C9|nr:PREDICTED: cysteine protease ATG4-like isoform X1 [Lupinus angustifolius]
MVLKNLCERIFAPKCSSKSSTDTVDNNQVPACSKAESSDSKFPKASLWSSFFTSGYSVCETYSESPASEKKVVNSTNSGWAASVRKVITVGSMRRFQERVLGPSKTEVSSSDGDVWLLGVCHKISQHESTGNVDTSNYFAALEEDFFSKILITYRKGFNAISDSKYTSDVNWGCMLRSGQMLVAQALLFHKLGRSWRKSVDKPQDKEYIDILQLFGDSEAYAFSIHNLLEAGKGYGLAVGSWVGPYAMCRTLEVLARNQRERNDLEEQPLPMAIYVVSGDEDGERGGAPVVCIEDASRRCSEFSRGLAAWTPLLLLVPLVLGLDKINPRYVPLLQSTFKFPQSLGILGGKPGASTYIIGVQNEKAFYLDPHDVHPVVNINMDNQEADTSSYHSNIIRLMPLDSIDPSLAIGFYCRDKDDFDNFCSRASELVEESNGAPLFTVAQSRSLPMQVSSSNDASVANSGFQEDDALGLDLVNDSETNEDDWQLL